jgi:hypothetical protein
MKKIIFIVVAIMVACSLNGQDHERKFLVYANGAYSQHKANSLSQPIGYSEELSGGKISAGTYWKVNNFFYAGIALEYEKTKEYTRNNIDNYTTPSDNSAISTYHSKFEKSKIVPTINFKFCKNLTERFTFGANVITGYEFMETMNLDHSVITISSSDGIPFFVSNHYEMSNKQGIVFMLQPELAYYVTNWLGISAQLDFYTFDSVNASQFFFAKDSRDIMRSVGIIFPIN